MKNIYAITSKTFLRIYILTFILIAAANANSMSKTSDIAFFLQDELLEGVNIEAAKLGDVMPIATFEQKAKNYSYSVILGKSNEANIEALLKAQKISIDNDWFGEQGFQINSWKDGNNSTTLVTGVTDVGVLYGLLDLPLQTEYLGLNTVEEYLDTAPSRRDKPFFQLRRGLMKDRANFIFSGGYHWPFDYSQWPEIYENQEQMHNLEEHGKKRLEDFERAYADAEKYGAKIFLWLYVPTFPVYSENFYKTHPEADARDNNGYLDPNAEIVKIITKEKFRAFWEKYPKLSGVYLSFKNGGQSYLTPSKASKPTHDSYKIAKEYILMIESAMRQSNPDATVIVRQWKLHRSGLELKKLTETLPDSIRYGCKVTCPPGNDYLWHDLFTPYLENVPNLLVNGLSGYNTDGPGGVVSHLCYEGPKSHCRALKIAKLTNYGAWTGDKTLESYIDFGKLRYLINTPSRRSHVYIGWNPYNFDPDTYISNFGRCNFGKKAGKHFAAAMKDIWKVTDAMVFMPEWNIDGHAYTGQLHMYHFFPDKRTGYATGLQQPKKFASITPDSPDFDSFYKRFDITEAVQLANFAEQQLSEALNCQPKNKLLLKTFHQASEATAALAQAWRNYHLGLLYYNAACNRPGHVKSAAYLKQAKEYISKSWQDMWKYRDCYFKIYPDILAHSTYRGKHPKLYLSFVTQEIQDAYHNVVIKPETGKFVPAWQVSSFDMELPDYKDRPGSEPIVKTVAIDKIKNNQLCPVMANGVLSELNLKFKTDLSKGGILKIVSRPWRDRSKRDNIKRTGGLYSFGISNIEILLDGVPVGHINDYSEQYTEYLGYSWARYIILPPSGKQEHTLGLKTLNGTGTHLKSLTLFANGVSMFSGIKEQSYSFSEPPLWTKHVSAGSKMKMDYDNRNENLRFECWREREKFGCFYQKFSDKIYGPIKCSFDFTIESSKYKAVAAFGLLGSEQQLLSGIKLYGLDSKKVKVSGSDSMLSTGQTYRVFISRDLDRLEIIVKNKSGEAVYTSKRCIDNKQELGYYGLGITNKGDSSQDIGPLILNIDNLKLSFLK